MIEKITNQNQISRHKLAEKINEIIDYINQNNHEYTSIEEVVKARENHIADVSKKVAAMSELKCPFCQQELQEDVGYDGDYSCPNCRQPYFGSPELWQELIRTRKALDVAVEALKLISLRYLCEYADKALDQIKQITALEQKDIK